MKPHWEYTCQSRLWPEEEGVIEIPEFEQTQICYGIALGKQKTVRALSEAAGAALSGVQHSEVRKAISELTEALRLPENEFA